MNIQEILNKWRLSKAEKLVILSNKDLMDRILDSHDKYSLPPNYIPNIINIKFDNVTKLMIRDAQETEVKPNNYSDFPTLIEILFDNECVLLYTSTKILIDRLNDEIGLEQIANCL